MTSESEDLLWVRDALNFIDAPPLFGTPPGAVKPRDAIYDLMSKHGFTRDTHFVHDIDTPLIIVLALFGLPACFVAPFVLPTILELLFGLSVNTTRFMIFLGALVCLIAYIPLLAGFKMLWHSVGFSNEARLRREAYAFIDVRIEELELRAQGVDSVSPEGAPVPVPSFIEKSFSASEEVARFEVDITL